MSEKQSGPHPRRSATPPLPNRERGLGGEGFKPTELSDLPADWDVVRLGDVCDVFSGYAFKTSDYIKQGIPLIKIGNLQDGSVVITGDNDCVPDTWLQDKKLQKYILRGGDVLIAMTGATTGKVAVFGNHLPIAFLNQRVGKIHPLNSRVKLHFISYYIQIEAFQKFIQQGILQSAQGNISPTKIKQIPIPLPPLDEQRRIARVLNTVQQAIAAQDDLIAAAQELKRSLMRRLFTYGPGPEPAPTQETEFGNVPEHWRIMKLDKCAFVQTGTAKGRKFGNHPTIEVPYLRVANVQDGYLDLSEIKRIRIKKAELDRYSLQYGDVVLTEGGDFDKLGRGFIWRGQIPNCIHQNHIFAVRANRELLTPEYLAYLVQSDYGKAYFLTVAHRTTNLASINTTKLKAFPVIIPPSDEQRQIAHILQAADAKIAAEQDRRAALRELFNSLLQALMTGRRRV